MPTLIRLVVALLFLAGLGYAGLFALTVFVDPGERQITVRIPARNLQVDANAGGNAISPTPRASNAPQPVLTSEPPADAPAPGSAEDERPE